MNLLDNSPTIKCETIMRTNNVVDKAYIINRNCFFRQQHHVQHSSVSAQLFTSTSYNITSILVLQNVKKTFTGNLASSTFVMGRKYLDLLRFPGNKVVIMKITKTFA